MSFVDFKEVNINNPGPANKWGADQLLEVMQIFNGKIVASRRPKIANEWLWLDHFDVKAPALVPAAPTELDTNRVYTDPTDFKLKAKKTGGTIVQCETTDITDAMIAASGITTRSKLPSPIAYEDEANTFTETQTIDTTTGSLLLLNNNALNVFDARVEGNVVQTRIAVPSNIEILHQWLVSDVTSGLGHLYIWNISAADGTFAPLLEALTNSGHPGLQIDPRCIGATDVGSTALFKISVSRNDLSDIVTRPLFSLGMRSSDDMLVMNVNGDITQKIRAQAGVAEILHEWTLSDDAISYLRIENQPTVDGLFRPRITGLASDSFTDLIFRAEAKPVNDVGSSPVMTFQSQRDDDTTINARPLFSFQNATTAVLVISTVDFDFTNKTLKNAVVDSSVTGIVNANIAAAAAIAYSKLALTDSIVNADVNTAAAIAYSKLSLANSIVDADIAASGITTRSKLPAPLVYDDEANTLTETLTINKTAQASSTENLLDLKVSDNAVGFILFRNRVFTDGLFRPEVQFLPSDNGAIRFSAMTTIANDTGSFPIFSFDAMQDDETPITSSRPLFAFRNAINDVLQILTTGLMMADAKNIEVGTTTGTKIGTATTQKLGFFNATPVTQRAANPDTSGALIGALETEVNEIKQVLRDLGFIAAA